MFEDFYSTFATVSLTVTGLWMYVASVRFKEWMADRDHFHRASAISVQLVFPGIMCLFALVDPASNLLWQIAFGTSSAVAVILLLSLRRRSAGRWPPANEIGNWLAVVIFACVALVAVTPGVVDTLGLPDVPRRTEFFLFCLLLVDGLVVAWMMLFSEMPETADR